jgi:A/G-specific adenine glycosylase
MELGALVCKPKNPLCTKCPIIKNCKSYKKQDFEISVKSKKKIDKFFIIKVFKRGNKILLIKNTKFKFLKNFKIFPMEEIKKPQNLNNSLNLKMANMNMNINIKRIKEFSNISNGSWIDQTKFNQYTLPTFTKKIFASLNKSL